MKFLYISVLFLATARFCYGGPLRLHKRAAFYVANETACVVDDLVYSMNEPIPTDNPCETCRCRPPGFACVLANCPPVKPGCREDSAFYNTRRTDAAQRDIGRQVERQCCPNILCDGCEFNGKTYQDGEKIPNPQQPCITCHCLGSSTVCKTEVCPSRINCAAEYVAGECCPRYTNCSSVDSVSEEATNSDSPTSLPIQPEVDRDRTEVIYSEASKGQEAPEINVSSDTLEKASETQERGSSSNSETSDKIDTTPQPIQNADLPENGPSETNNESEILNIDPEIIKEEHIADSKKPVGENSTESPIVDSDDLAPVKTEAPKENADETTEEHKLGETTVAQDQPPSDLITTAAPSKHEKEIETNTIEKRFRSLENATVEEQSDDVKTADAENQKTIGSETGGKTSTSVSPSEHYMSTEPNTFKEPSNEYHSTEPNTFKEPSNEYHSTEPNTFKEPSNEYHSTEPNTFKEPSNEYHSTEPNTFKEPSNAESGKEAVSEIPN